MVCLLATIDIGTSVIKAAIFDLNGRLKSLASKLSPCVYNKQNGFIEQDPKKIISGAFSSLKEAIKKSKADPSDIISVAISTQRATVVCTDRGGTALGHAISWQDMRANREIAALRERISDDKYYKIGGIPNNPVFSLGKILWIKENDRSLYKKCRFSLVHDFFLKQMGCDDFYLDWSNASLSGMFDIKKNDWSDDILRAAGIERVKLPTLVSPGSQIGKVSKLAAKACGLCEGTPIIAGGGDQQCSGIGSGAVDSGIVEVTLGTAGVSLSYSEKPIFDPKMRISCCAHAVAGKWEIEGLQNSAGASLEWISKIVSDGEYFRNNFFKKVSAVGPGSGGIFFYPHLAGASAPNWNAEARGAFVGLNHSHDKASIARSVMEGVSFETRQIFDVYAALGIDIREVRVTGGCSDIAVWDQMQADIYGRDVVTLATPQTSLLGAAMLGAYGVGAFGSIKEATDKMVHLKKRFKPDTKASGAYKKHYNKYCELCGVVTSLKLK